MGPGDEVLAIFPDARLVASHTWKTDLRGWQVTIAGEPGCWRCFLRFGDLDVRGYGDAVHLQTAFDEARLDVYKQYEALRSAVEVL